MVGSFGTPAKKESAELESNPSSKTPGVGSTVIVVIPLGLPGMGKSSLLERLFQMGQQAAVKTYRQGKLEKPGDGAGQPLKTLHSVATLSSDEFTGDELKMLRISTSQFGGGAMQQAKVWRSMFSSWTGLSGPKARMLQQDPLKTWCAAADWPPASIGEQLRISSRKRRLLNLRSCTCSCWIRTIRLPHCAAKRRSCKN